MNRRIFRVMKNNTKSWLCGPTWQGKKCLAKTRRGTQCKRPARLLVGRLRLHGAASTGPRTKEGLARLTEARTKHGRFTKEKRAEAKWRAEVGAQMIAELKEIEQWALDHGHLDKNWRDSFK